MVCRVNESESRCHQSKSSIAQTLGAALDLGRVVTMNFLPALASIGAAEDIESLPIDANKRAFVTGNDLALGH
jgi:hypothetical protein